MGRGRQKAKDAKIARQLKYATHGSDIRDLERELIGGHHDTSVVPVIQPESSEKEEYEEYDYSRWEEDDEDED